MNFEFPDSVELAKLPTPIDLLERLSNSLEGPRIYVKRDDETGIAVTGNKVRKLEFLLAEALARGCDTVITCGGYQSNHARTTAVVAARLGLKCHLVLRNGLSASMDGNLFIDRLVGAEIQYVSPEEYMRIDDVMQQVARDVKSSGNKSYIIPEGGSNEIGALGYLKAAREIAEQLRAMKLKIHHIIVPLGSGGTQAGLLLGKYLFDLPARIHGINVCDDKAYFVSKIHKLLQRIERRFNMDIQIGKEEIRVIDGYVGKGYGLSSQEEIDLIKQIAKMEGVILDPVYTGKAMFGLLDQVKKGGFTADENILFIHTGGIFGLFPKRTLFF
ncbi:MAG: D-cysteine desulfhydrase family protein [bacterium]